MNSKEIQNYKEAGEISKKVKEYARKIIKPGVLLKDVAEKIENKIIELGGKPAFPVNLSINEIAAHYTPSSNDENTAKGLLKIDLGVHIKGYISDTAFSLDLENSEQNKDLIKASKLAIEKVEKNLKPGIEIFKIGEIIQNQITSFNFSPIKNLSGHSLNKYQIHSGITIPNYNNNNKNKLIKGAYAIEPFATSGQGEVYEGKPSGIYSLIEKKPVRNQQARKILEFIEQEYLTIPFCERWICKKFSQYKIALSLLEKQGIIRQYPQLIEKSKSKVAQTEHTFLIKEKVEKIS